MALLAPGGSAQPSDTRAGDLGFSGHVDGAAAWLVLTLHRTPDWSAAWKSELSSLDTALAPGAGRAGL